MKTDLNEIKESLHSQFKSLGPLLKIRKDSETAVEIAGCKEVMQGKQKVDGFYFSSIVPKQKDIRWYFFPIYTHVDAFNDLSDELKKCKKGKSCFHIKKMSSEMEAEIEQMMKKGLEFYKNDGLI
jgi:hypothetical protein